MAAPGSRAEHPPPFHVHRLDVADRSDQIGDGAVGRSVVAPGADVVFRRGLFPVLDLGHFGTVPPSTRGQVPAGQPRVPAQVTQLLAERLACLVKGVRHDEFVPLRPDVFGLQVAVVRDRVLPGPVAHRAAMIDDHAVAGGRAARELAGGLKDGEHDQCVVEEPEVVG